ncbi:putative FAD-dependent oxygenase [Hypoxylon crocopeplum]|nr:putative FAD-dependent oxygenase [Hypoxylon crocopeplum]
MFDFFARPTQRLKMEVVTAIAAWALSSACQNIPASHWLSPLCSRGNLTGLTTRLSSGAHVHYPGSDGFTEATTRWSVFDAPGINVVVVPGVESDVAEIVKYANENNKPYLAVSGGHGAITTTARMKDGIEIWMDQLSGVEIAEDGASATIRGGTLSKNVTHALWAAGKQTVTGGCECTSLLGPGLGGGHGILQGRHGLVSDQFLSMNIVLADGSLQIIDKTSGDLWWAVQGAGHNFGIVTSVSLKIYDIQYHDWAYETFTFTSEKFEGLFESINENLLNNGSPPVDIINYGFFLNSPDIDPKPVTMFWVIQEGATTVDSAHTRPFHELGPISTDAGSGTYLDIPRWVGWDNEAAPCQHTGLANTRFPIDIESYDVQAMRKMYDLFTSATQETPALNGSFFLFEGYSLKGVKVVPPESTAFAFRGDNILVAPVISWVPSGPELAQKATDLGNDLRRILYDATGRTELHAYVNYAFGDETPKNWYGYEQWRQDSLLALKNKYDPMRKFSFYAPIA